MQQLLRRITERKLNPVTLKYPEQSGYWSCMEAIDKQKVEVV